MATNTEDANVSTAMKDPQSVAGAWVAGLEWAALPEHVREATERAVLNSVGTGVGGFGQPEAAIAVAAALAEEEQGPCTLFVDGTKVSATTAMFTNAVVFNSLQQEEMHIPSATHPLEVVTPVALALAERRPTTGVQLLEAILAGVEVATAFGRVDCMPSVAAETVETAAVYGALGAAATASRALGLDAAETAHAIGIAANLSAGLSECLWSGTTEYHYSVADAARNGYLAAQLAARGGEATPTTFAGKAGFYRRFGEIEPETLASYDFVAHLEGVLGNTWGITEQIFKPYPVHFQNLPFIDAAKTLLARHDITPERITAIRLTINGWCEVCDGASLGPYSGREATLGATAFAVAAMLARGEFGLRETLEHDAEDIMTLVQRTAVSTFTDPADAASTEAVYVEVEVDGETYVYDSKVEGIPDYRLPMPAIRAIATSALERVVDPENVGPAVDAFGALPSVEDVGALIPLLVRHGA